MSIGLYIHIPFCKEKCYYCDFLSFSAKDEYFDVYKNALISELKYYSSIFKNNNNKNNINTIFIGGGTPSIVPVGYISDVLEFIYYNFNIDKNAEISIEANPGTLSYSKIKNFKDSGINRISLGLQSYNNKLLKTIGRIHTIEDFTENYNNMRKVGFDNINIDLMFSLPNQTLFDFKDTLESITALAPEHISTYSLILEEDTKFFDLYNNNKLELPSDDLDREFYYMAKDMLAKNNYNLYEISNFAKNNKECRHNLVYWERKPYLGVGLGASSYFTKGLLKYNNNINNSISNIGSIGSIDNIGNISNIGNINNIDNIRRKNTDNFKEYINYDFNNFNDFNNKFFTQELLTLQDDYSEFMFLGLRLTKGISKQDFYKEFSVSIESVYNTQIQKFLSYGLLIQEGDILKLSSKGIDLSNVVFSEFI